MILVLTNVLLLRGALLHVSSRKANVIPIELG